MRNVSDYSKYARVHEAQICALRFIIIPRIIATNKCTGGWHCESTLKDGLPDQEGLKQRNTFSRYRASQSRGSPKRTAIAKPSVKHIVISIYLNSVFI